MFEAVGIIGTVWVAHARYAHASAPAPPLKYRIAEGMPCFCLPSYEYEGVTQKPGSLLPSIFQRRERKRWQIPSETVVAYLRSGLTADGSSRTKAEGVTA